VARLEEEAGAYALPKNGPDRINRLHKIYQNHLLVLHKEKKKSSRLGKKRDSETLSRLFYLSLEVGRVSYLSVRLE
jgi:hypothetical protein